MAKNKRGKRHKRNKSNQENKNSTLEVDEIRTCVSGEKLDKSCVNSLHIVDLLSPIVTPSPKSNDRRTNSCLANVIQANSFRPRSRSSISRLNSPMIEKMSLPEGKLIFETPRTSFPKKKCNVDETVSPCAMDYKTPMKRLRSASFMVNLSQSISQPSKRTKSFVEVEKTGDNTSDNMFFTPRLNKKSPPKEKILDTIHYSTPKNILHEKKKKEANISNGNASRQSLGSIQSLSPILKNEPELKPGKICIPTSGPSVLSPSRRAFGCFRKHKKSGGRWPLGLVDLCTWLGITLKKAVASIRRYCYESVVVAVPKIVQSPYKNCCCHSKIYNLNAKIDNQSAELARVTRELEDLRKEFVEFKQLATRAIPPTCGAPVPPPPPPPPMPPLPILPTPSGRPTKIAIRKIEKQNSNENSRPLITVDDILKVRLRKTTASVSTFSKKPTQNPEELFRHIKLRPPARNQSPSMISASPKSSLTRILKNVDTNVRMVRRYRQIPSISYDEFSRQRCSRAVKGTPNDSAPVL